MWRVTGENRKTRASMTWGHRYGRCLAPVSTDDKRTMACGFTYERRGAGDVVTLSWMRVDKASYSRNGRFGVKPKDTNLCDLRPICPHVQEA